jgi:SAM-dependent methyltransferase
MRLSATLLLVIAAHVVFAFQVNPDDSPAFAETAVEKTIKTPKPMDTRPYHESIFISAEMVSGLPTLPDLTERVDPGPTNYWFNSRIHAFGNTGLFGGLHAAVAPLFTKLIDVVAYDGNPVRDEISQNLRSLIGKPNARVLDLCCGVGISTRALQSAFHDAEVVIGIDTSPEMIAMATMQSSKNLLTHFAKVIDSCMEFGSRAVKERIERFPSYAIGNAEYTDLAAGSFDLVTIM